MLTSIQIAWVGLLSNRVCSRQTNQWCCCNMSAGQPLKALVISTCIQTITRYIKNMQQGRLSLLVLLQASLSKCSQEGTDFKILRMQLLLHVCGIVQLLLCMWRSWRSKESHMLNSW